MIYSGAALSADRMDDRFCELCGNPAGPHATLTRAGLSTCRDCGIHACQRCWARSVGYCPACRVSIAATGIGGSMPRAPEVPVAAATPGQRSSRGRLAALAAAGGALVLTASAFAFMFAAQLRPTGGVAGATGTPRLDGVGLASPVASQDAVGSDSTTTRTGTGSGATGPGPTDAPGPGGDHPSSTPDSNAPRPAPTPKPAAVPTPKPTLTPGPVATPAPTAGGCVAIAPNLVGQHRSDARRLWIEAGFTGAVTALEGRGNYVITSQNRTPGARYACDTGVTIGP